MKIVMVLFVLVFSLPAAAQEKNWEKEWNNLIATARQEGKVVVAGSPDDTVRREVPAAFTARFGIPVEYISGRSDLAEKIRVERSAGVYSIDFFFAGITTFTDILFAEKMLDPLRPALLLPEVLDATKWKKGKIWFIDPEERYVLRLLNYVTEMFFINTQQVKAGDIRSIKDLLNPNWKGKIVAYDPTVAGSGSNDATLMYRQFGEDFVKRLYIEQKPVISRDRRQITDWLARGTYSIAVSADNGLVSRFQKDGFPVRSLGQLPDAPGAISAGNGLGGVMNKAPHPSAARVFANWIASREGLQVYARARLNPSTRNDIDESYVDPDTQTRPGVDYFDSYDWQFAGTERKKIGQRLKDILKFQ